ncbi:MAG: protein-methionine-sulfoxide reductase catalytic subunit MsrP [Bosea sp.]|uniref:protein-methionine-sulfoxide reductase catalytic subunit MsrP n=1 Tax=unclassified Bosea (in: a-proteobacteria) TaxID=2653178 RepID=UPI0009592AEA|nr:MULTISPECIES: protein-methionine-sulfoxide reductase catalytic subunit MsrP [unclassified Bosea (in: a-proteobacteria)]MBN9455976.1 protein-methionine-sulfoxide reductase catalytic subunit MsrP [Bosea sp. (in: a-proteobacteria)]OJV05870.1 MAG: mononuclear molybdenum enzyme YedY [Bosea sp. 67-29]
MLIKRRAGWELPEIQATPESVFLNRRQLMAAGAGLIAGAALPGIAAAEVPDPTLDLYPAKRNETYKLDVPLTKAEDAANYNNFYEFGMSKDIVDASHRLATRPWSIQVDGMVDKPFEIGFDDLVRKLPLEERLYRFRCVEAWAMAVPWTGIPLKAFVAMAKPLSGAKYIRFETFLNPRVAPGQNQRWYPWPYVEGLTMAEAGNELPLLVTGIYGKPLPTQHGAPIRLITPWKYGFKSVKSIRRISFVAERPKTFWEALQASEYGFWANVNPAVPHPRWSQASEQVLGSRERRPTLIYNGYGEQVAGLYKGLEGEALFM